MLVDITLDANHDYAFANNDLIVSDSTAQRIKQRLGVLKGEWFLDSELGIPYIDELFDNKTGTPRLLESIIRTTIETTYGVSKILSFTTNYNFENRFGEIIFEVEYSDGTTESLEVTV